MSSTKESRRHPGSNSAPVAHDWASPPIQMALQEELSDVTETLRHWVQAPHHSDLERLRPSFRALARSFRAKGFSLEENLDALGDLEESLLDELHRKAEGMPQPGAPAGGASTDAGPPALRSAMRAMIKETVRLNLQLEDRRGREYGNALSDFGEILAHELGNRLGAARTGVELLQELPEMDPERRKRITALVAAGIDGVLATVEDVAAYMEAHHWVEGAGLPFPEVVRQVAKGLHPLARREGVEVRIREPLPQEEVEGARLRLILSNVLVNAVRYSDRGKPESWVELTARTEDAEWIRVEVTDNGVGVAPEDRERIFGYMERGGDPGHRPSGSGLGLAIVWEAVQQLGGQLELESTLGEGSCFRFRIPRNPRASGLPPSAGGPARKPVS